MSNTNHGNILAAIEEFNKALQEENPLGARVQLVVACELIEALGTDVYDDVLLKAEGACTALETAIFGTDTQKLEFRTIIDHESNLAYTS